MRELQLHANPFMSDIGVVYLSGLRAILNTLNKSNGSCNYLFLLYFCFHIRLFPGSRLPAEESRWSNHNKNMI